MNPAPEKRRGFTLVELLAVIAIIGVLIGLLLPAVQAAREAMRRSACANKIRQIALGMHSHHDARQSLPFGHIPPWGATEYVNGVSGTVKNDRRCWMHMVCPYLEMTSVYDAVMLQVTSNSTTAPAAGNQQHPLFMCPSDPNAGKISYFQRDTYGESWINRRGFCGNYLASASSGTFGPAGTGTDLNGLFFVKSKVRFSEVTDGLSKTTMLGECIVVPDPGNHIDCRGGYFNAHYGETLFSTLRQPNTSVGDGLSYTTNWLPWAPNGSTGYVQYTRSRHSGGVNVAMADASTRFVSNTVAADVWTAAGSRNGSESLPGIE
jgi:prepilin-type N-terminal cleavage/methylation domain-containing protein/prepilin-type processing-associated H-X9-DG protein